MITRDWEGIAREQAATMEERRLANVTLRQLADEAKADREAALDLAEQYALKAGVVTDRDVVLRYVTQYWVQRGAFEKQFDKLEAQRWEVLTVARDLGELAAGRRVTDLDVTGVAQLIAKVLTEVATAQVPRRAVEMFARPEPEQPSLFGEAS